MKIAVVVRQVPDLIEPLEIADSGNALDLEDAGFLVNESDDHALEQALLLKEASGGSVAVVALDFGDIDNTLYSASAKGADQVIKIEWDEEIPPPPRAAAAIYADAIKDLQPDLVFVGLQGYDELEGVLPPMLALALELPYLGVIRGVQPAGEGTLQVFKEFPGAVMNRYTVRPPAVLGILTADQPPRYVPVTRIRAAMKSAEFEERDAAEVPTAATVAVARLYPPESGERAEILSGSDEEVAARIAKILAEKGLIK
jgi:electron transfer flavoprotein beta subunit